MQLIVFVSVQYVYVELNKVRDLINFSSIKII